jgi:hypothetical protein
MTIPFIDCASMWPGIVSVGVQVVVGSLQTDGESTVARERQERRVGVDGLEAPPG